MFKKILILGLLFCSFQISAQTVTKGLIGKQDIHNWDGKTQTFTRESSTGYDITLNDLDWVGVDVCQVYGGGINRTSTALSAAITAIGSTEKTELYLSKGVWTVTGNVSIPANYTLHFAQGAYLDGAFTITFAGSPDTQIKALSGQQIFGSSLTVTFGVGGTKYPNWWATNTTPGTTDMASAIQAAINAGNGEVVLLAQIYRINTKIIQNVSNKSLRGQGKSITEIYWYGTGVALESDYTTSGFPSLGSIQWKDFSIVNYSADPATAFYLDHFTFGCKLDGIKITGFDIGIDTISSWYSSIINCDIEECDLGLQYGEEMNDFEVFNCAFARNKMHVAPSSTISGYSFGFIMRDCAFDGMGSTGMIHLKNIIKGVIEGAYMEVYATDDGLANDAIIIGEGCISINVTNNIMIGPADASYTGKWIDVTTASVAHTISNNMQYRASGATFLTTTTGSSNIEIVNNYAEAPHGTFAAGSVVPTQVIIRYPSTLGSTEIDIGLFKTPKITGYHVYLVPDEAIDMTGLNFQVYRRDTDLNILNKALGNYTARQLVDLGDINALISNIYLSGFIFKDGASVATPQCTLIFEHY